MGSADDGDDEGMRSVGEDESGPSGGKAGCVGDDAPKRLAASATTMAGGELEGSSPVPTEEVGGISAVEAPADKRGRSGPDGNSADSGGKGSDSASGEGGKLKSSPDAAAAAAAANLSGAMLLLYALSALATAAVRDADNVEAVAAAAEEGGAGTLDAVTCGRKDASVGAGAGVRGGSGSRFIG